MRWASQLLPNHALEQPGASRETATGAKVFEPAAHLVNPPHRLAIGREPQDGAVVDDDLRVAPVCPTCSSSYWIGSPALGSP